MIHRPRYDDWSLPKGKVDPGETEPVAAVREVLEETGHHAILGRRLDMVSYPIDQGVKKVYYWAARSTGGEFTPGNEVDELVWLPVADAIGQTQLRPRSKDVAPLRKATRRHTHRAGGPARHRRQEITFLRRRHQTTAGQEGTRAGGGTGSTAAGLRRHRRVCGRPAPLPPDGGTARRGTRRDHPQRAHPDRGVLRQEPQARSPPDAAHRRGGRHPGDLHAGQGDSGPDRLVVRTRRGASRQVPQPQGQHVGAVAVGAAGWWRPTTSAARWPPTCGPNTRIPFGGIAATRRVSACGISLTCGRAWPAAFLAGAFLARLLGRALVAAFLAGAFFTAFLA